MRLVGDGLIVDVQKPRIEPVADGKRTADISGEYAGREAIFVVVGELHRLVVLPIEVIAATGPKISSSKARMPGFTPVSTVGL